MVRPWGGAMTVTGPCWRFERTRSQAGGRLPCSRPPDTGRHTATRSRRWRRRPTPRAGARRRSWAAGHVQHCQTGVGCAAHSSWLIRRPSHCGARLGNEAVCVERVPGSRRRRAGRRSRAGWVLARFAPLSSAGDPTGWVPRPTAPEPGSGCAGRAPRGCVLWERRDTPGGYASVARRRQ